MKRLQWPRARGSVWRVRIAAVTVTLAAFGLGATWKDSFDLRKGHGDMRLAFKIAKDAEAPAHLRLQAMTSMHRDVMAARRAFKELASDTILGPHARRFTEVEER